MKNLIKWICRGFLLFSFAFAQAQPKTYTTANAHAHNDYLNKSPFHQAHENGFGSIEVDIFPVGGILCVAHSKREIKPELTLKSLYIDPLLNAFAKSNAGKLKLLVDIKENYKLSLELLVKEIEPLKQYLFTSPGNGSIIILISGSRPPPAEYKNYPAYIFFDDDLQLKHNAVEWERVGQVSLPFTKFSKWKADTDITKKEKKLLKHIVDSVHRAGKTIRFWAAPDNEASWKLQMKLGVDLIGTDKVEELANFLRRKKKK